MNTTTSGLFGIIDIIRNRPVPTHAALKSPGKRHPYFYNLDPQADYRLWTAPGELWTRENGKVHKKDPGNTSTNLRRCIRNLNKQYRTNKDEFVFRDDTIPVWAAGAECSSEFLMAAILADKEFQDTPIYHYICRVMDEVYE